jgi:hypothetical protein
MDPHHRVAMDPEPMLDKYDVVFFGRLSSFEFSDDTTQIAEFEVLDVYKGPGMSLATIHNLLTTSCSRTFEVPSTNYYVFAMIDPDSGNYTISGFASFVPESVAEEREMQLAKPHNKSLKADAVNGTLCGIAL